MTTLPKSMQALIKEFSKMPGVGPKSAERLAFYILRTSGEDVQSLLLAISEVKKSVQFCKICNNLSDADVCTICQDQTRNKTVLCVVEEPNDIIAIEKTKNFNGRYFCLLGALSPLDGIGPEELKIASLVERIRSEGIKEVIIATDSDDEGDTTALYLAKILKPLGVKLTRIGYGIPVGSNLEYMDQATLIKALEGRTQFS